MHNHLFFSKFRNKCYFFAKYYHLAFLRLLSFKFIIEQSKLVSISSKYTLSENTCKYTFTSFEFTPVLKRLYWIQLFHRTSKCCI